VEIGLLVYPLLAKTLRGTDGRTDGRTDKTKIIVPRFRSGTKNFLKAELVHKKSKAQAHFVHQCINIVTCNSIRQRCFGRLVMSVSLSAQSVGTKTWPITLHSVKVLVRFQIPIVLQVRFQIPVVLQVRFQIPIALTLHPNEVWV
jgi:hypothetical protein